MTIQEELAIIDAQIRRRLESGDPQSVMAGDKRVEYADLDKLYERRAFLQKQLLSGGRRSYNVVPVSG